MALRRGPGLTALSRTRAAREQFKRKGEEVAETKAAVMKAQMAHFKASLEEFALKHKADIRRNPEFRAQFHAMCATAGVDPLASNKGTWNKLLGLGDFYYELGVQVVEGCITSRPITGGFIELSRVHEYVRRRRGSRADPVSEDDLLRAIEKLQGLGSGFGVVRIGNRSFVRSVPTEISTDSNTLIELAERSGGYFSLADAVAATGWQEARLRDALGAMAREGLLLIDDQPGAAPAAATGPLAAGGASPAALPRLYWVPAVGLLPGTDRYRRDAGLEGIPLPPTADIATATLAGAGEAQAPGQVRVEQPAVPPVAALGGMHLTGQ
ncbi:hypothetical protein CHLNCDRAFT_36297 [Chlorella variabilis]|uniref:Vacuolar protein sorting-associated protein n=1 Tax=Chlorella variabilis TaxID=554065 RepID=E1ZJA4_CHLVA|nr:hypothetical protein CHLNCDRAFT_36297 [Chlorella variabilis]EFN53961.1 hypothetical protein CHLNCDRAFT_36297 [Chlorella variabilis]|eukprot:XP_005846063.1 hypothetical protein CHLNCDRAFT_36297 [Chlorella variabilis]